MELILKGQMMIYYLLIDKRVLVACALDPKGIKDRAFFSAHHHQLLAERSSNKPGN